ncbi:4'-phosphopantetheinyl transferase family protein [Phytomonospora endophytica]|uniref:Phosphopantetheinyl transferase n=1 Tax=Phytomonospora endophytica TaxID=714109 RepID=A0A841FC39_9ACTN|nr:hypothetical protein [Phytomonospora endophytica]MBB6032955.1 phosphopantetheinyl transferase [Phytomonospora endophytica]GIG65181.1 hypothetical protein Pen01_14760 [Phytomonospora endophytica]
MIVRWAVAGPVTADLAFTALEREKAARFRFGADRLAYLAAHALVRECAAELLGVPASGLVLGQRCPDCRKDDHGRPFIEGHDGVHVSLSHTRGFVAAAASRTPVGVDIEGVGSAVPDEVLAPAERAAGPLLRLHRWVLKESLIKVGATRLDELASVDLSVVTGEGGFAWRGWDLRTEAVAGEAAVLGVAGEPRRT